MPPVQPRFLVVNANEVIISLGDDMFLATFHVPHPESAGELRDWRWSLKRAVFQYKTRLGLVKKPRHLQKPRFALVGLFDRLRDCRKFIVTQKRRKP